MAAEKGDFPRIEGLNYPAVHAFDVTPDDDANLPQLARGLYIGTAGDLTVVLTGDDLPVTFKNAPAGLLPIAVKQVMATGTAADDIVGIR